MFAVVLRPFMLLVARPGSKVGQGGPGPPEPGPLIESELVGLGPG